MKVMCYTVGDGNEKLIIELLDNGGVLIFDEDAYTNDGSGWISIPAADLADVAELLKNHAAVSCLEVMT